jgi:endonuclease/exonuclease/phosphatase family metal-dependent hydrolase
MHVAFGANIPLQGGQYGNAVLSRFPISEHENFKLPNVDDGKPVSLGDYRGKKTLLVHFASW